MESTVYRYHDGTKHHFHRFAQSLGYLDWASQPAPFRAYTGAAEIPLHPAPAAASGDYAPHLPAYAELFDDRLQAQPISPAAIGDVLRHALGLSAWKQFASSRWSLRVNPSSGNLHPTEAYVICGAVDGWSSEGAVYHYAPDRHLLERRCVFAPRPIGGFFVALTSIHWREAWKYGERAFRYCQHDLGHAIAAVSVAAGLTGWDVALLPEWSRSSIGALAGVDRDDDFVHAEREEPGCLLAVTPHGHAPVTRDPRALVDAVRSGRWTGRASQLSEDHVEWTFIDEIAHATEDGGRDGLSRPTFGATHVAQRHRPVDARAILLRRRSAVAFDGVSRIDRSRFFDMLARAMPGAHRPWTTLWWTPRIHLAIFVHRVDDVAPGLYLLARDAPALDRLRAACGKTFLWEAAHDELPFVCLARGDCRSLAARASCDQDIASDGFFSLGMIAEFEASLEEHGASFYRNLFWESGVVGQVLYLEAEAAGARATGIGCFYDDPVHELLGLQGHAFQSLYHFTVGMPVEDRRLTTEPGYTWER